MPPEAGAPGALVSGPPWAEGAFDGIGAALDADPDLVVSAVGPPELVQAALAERGIQPGERVLVVPANRAVGPGPDAPREVRAHRDASVRVAARMVRDGRADAVVSAAAPEAVVAAAHFTLGLLPGATRPALGTVVEGRLGPVVLCDAGAATTASADELAQFALAGSAYAVAGLGVANPRVGLLSARPALADAARSAADATLRILDVGYVGRVGAGVLAGFGSGGRGGGHGGGRGGVDVAVTDGFTGDLLLSGARPDVGGDTAAIVLGVPGVVVCVRTAWPHGAGVETPAAGGTTAGRAWAQAIAMAATACRTDLVANVRSAMSGLLAQRRLAVGRLAGEGRLAVGAAR